MGIHKVQVRDIYFLLGKKVEVNNMVKVRRGRGLVERPIKPPQTKTSPFQNKKIEEKKTFFESTTGKVVAVALIILIVSIPFIAMGFYGVNGQPQENEWAKQHCYAPLTETSQRFERYAEGFVHNGRWTLQTDREDTYSCAIQFPSEEAFKNCVVEGEQLRTAVLNHPDLKSLVFTQEAFEEKGFVLALNSDSTYVSLSMNPRLRGNYEKALHFAEKEVLVPDFSEGDIEAILKKMNSILVEGIEKEKVSKAFLECAYNDGSYRKLPIVVQHENINDPDLMKEIEESFGQEAFEAFNSAVTKVQAGNKLTPFEKMVYDYLVYTPPAPEKVPEQMQQFVAEYREKLRCLDEDPFDFAAWVHMRLVDIHPYIDANGREARIMMNAELIRAGYTPVVFFDDVSYTEAIREEHISPGAFADHLRQVYDKSLTMRAIQNLPTKV